MFSDLALRSVLSGQYCCLHCVDEETVGLRGDPQCPDEQASQSGSVQELCFHSPRTCAQ